MHYLRDDIDHERSRRRDSAVSVQNVSRDHLRIVFQLRPIKWRTKETSIPSKRAGVSSSMLYSLEDVVKRLVRENLSQD